MSERRETLTTTDRIKRRVDRLAADVEAEIGDDEVWHERQINIYESVLRAIAEGKAEDPAGAARQAMRLAELWIARWGS